MASGFFGYGRHNATPYHTGGHYDLAGEWLLTAPEKYACTGQIPGSVYSFLLASGQMDDPYYRENEFPALALMENDTWTEVPVPRLWWPHGYGDQSLYTVRVELLDADADCVLSDNYFDMNAGQRQIKVLEGKPDSVKVRSVFDIR